MCLSLSINSVPAIPSALRSVSCPTLSCPLSIFLLFLSCRLLASACLLSFSPFPMEQRPEANEGNTTKEREKEGEYVGRLRDVVVVVVDTLWYPPA